MQRSKSVHLHAGPQLEAIDDLLHEEAGQRERCGDCCQREALQQQELRVTADSSSKFETMRGQQSRGLAAAGVAMPLQHAAVGTAAG
jgi:hypothetical protein